MGAVASTFKPLEEVRRGVDGTPSQSFELRWRLGGVLDTF
jgi:hypothetical protein